jgi:transposase
MRNLLALLWGEWKELEQQIVEMNMEVEQIASSDAACQRLQRIPGIGPLIATAIVAAIGNGAAFRKGRSSRHGWGLCRDSTLLAVKRSCSASASAATVIYAKF